MAIQLSDVTLEIGDETVGIIPNSLTYTEGLGEQKVRAVSIGGGSVEQVYANDLEGAISTVKFEMPTTIENVSLARLWKTSGNSNFVRMSGSAGGSDFTKSIASAALTADYEVPIGTEANISIEMMGETAS